MRARFFLCITVLVLCHPQLWPQAVTKQLPLSNDGAAASVRPPASATNPASEEPTTADLPDDPSMAGDVPVARVVPTPQTGVPVTIRAQTQEAKNNVYTLSGEVEIDYRDYVLRADRVTYNVDTRDAQADGHVQLDGGIDDEHFIASRGTINMDAQTGHFYDVVGTLGVRHVGTGRSAVVYTTPNPFALTARELIKMGPRQYRIVGGSMTSCRLPKPDWRFLAGEIAVDESKAHARNTRFQLLGLPLLYLPYVSLPVESAGRQSGLLIPIAGNSSTKGYIVGEEVYWAINRSMDAMVGAEYYSKRGWAPMGEFRYRGRGLDFGNFRFHSLLDRGLAPAHIDQGGTDVLLDGRRDLGEHTRAVADLEYLSSYVYRQAFEDTFALAISSEVKSQAFVTHLWNGYAASARFDRYQSFQSDTPGDEVRVLHLPTLQFDVDDHALAGTPLQWSFVGTASGLSRSEPGFATSREVARTDIYPHLSMPLNFQGWSFRPEFALRDTFYSKSQDAGPSGSVPTERNATLNREDIEAGIEIRPPVLERDFNGPWLEKKLGLDLRHTLEPALKYRYVGGIDNFHSVLRFDDVDIASDTHEVEYSLTQRLFLRHLGTHKCKDDEAATASGQCSGGTNEWLTWQLAQKYFFQPRFGGAVERDTRNVLDATLDLTGVAFLSGPRHYSPVVSRLRMRTTSQTDLEWDLDYDTRTGRITSSNIFAGYRKGDYYLAVAHLKLNAPEGVATAATSLTPVSPVITNYNQLRLTGTYGSPTKLGFSVGGNAGYDFALSTLQYGSVQTGYNWNCCGLNFEYRRYVLGSARNDSQKLYSFTLSNLGTGGSLRRAERIF
jgi:LPS-assembly protein